MGLEGVELVMEFEDEFGLQIPDDVAEKMPSVRDVIEYVHAELRNTLPQAESCLTSRSFYRLRRELTKFLSLPRRNVTPKTELGSLIPQERRREVWLRMSLETMRSAIDQYHKYVEEGLVVQEDVEQRGYPLSLDELVEGVEINEPDSPEAKIIVFLQRETARSSR